MRKDTVMNIVYVSKEYYAADKQRNAFTTGPINWVSDLRPDHSHPLACKVGAREFCHSTFHRLVAQHIYTVFELLAF